MKFTIEISKDRTVEVLREGNGRTEGRLISPSGVAFDSDLRYELEQFIKEAVSRGLLREARRESVCTSS